MAPDSRLWYNGGTEDTMPQVDQALRCRTAQATVKVRGGRCEHTSCPERCAFQAADDPDVAAMTAEILCPIGWKPMTAGDCGQGKGCLACCPYSSPSSSSLSKAAQA